MYISFSLFIASFFLVFVIEGIVGTMIVYGFFSNLIGTGFARGLEILSLIGLTFVYEKNLSIIGLSKEQIGYGTITGILWSFGFGIVVLCIGLIMFFIGYNPVKMLSGSFYKDSILLYIVIGGVLGPIGEEIFFRGFVFGFLRRWGILFAVIVSTLFFVSMHPNVGITQIVGGILFTVAYVKTECLLTPIVIHTVGNITLFAISLLL